MVKDRKKPLEKGEEKVGREVEFGEDVTLPLRDDLTNRPFRDNSSTLFVLANSN